jgi:hypothetical protein
MQGVTGRARLIWGCSEGEFLCCAAVLGVLVASFLTQVLDIFPKIAATEPLNLAVRSKVYWAERWATEGLLQPDASAVLAEEQRGNYTDALPDEHADGSVSYVFNDKLPNVAGAILTIRPALSDGGRQIIWICGQAPVPPGFTVRGEDVTDAPARFLNSACRKPRR